MATVKVVLRKKVNKDGTYPLALRVTKDRKTSFIHLGYNLLEKEWDKTLQRVKKSHPNSVRLNNYILKQLAESNDKFLELASQKTEVSSYSVKQKLKSKGTASFFKSAQTYIDDLKRSGKYNQYTPDKSRLNNFRVFLKEQDLSFSDITVSLLEKFKVYLKAGIPHPEKKTVRHMSDRTIINHMVVIRSVFSRAIKEGTIDKKLYPFGPGKIKIKFPDSAKIGLQPEEVQALEDLELPLNSTDNHARNLWLFSFYLAGMRVSDVFRLKWSDIQNERLHYSMGKNDKGGSLKLPIKALNIISQYESQKNHENDYIFPELKRIEENSGKFIIQRTIAFASSRIDKFLNKNIAPKMGLNKPLTMHIARHTFGNISGDRIPIQMLQKLYRHSSITTTIGYQANFIHKETDEALESVISF